MFLGAKVTIDRKSLYWDTTLPANPKGIAGRVVGCSSDIFCVRWGDGSSNTYLQGVLKVLGTVVKEEN